MGLRICKKGGANNAVCALTSDLEIIHSMNFDMKYLVQGKIENLFMMGSWSFELTNP